VEPAFIRSGVSEFGVRAANCRRKVPPRGVFGEGDDRRVEDGDDSDDSAPWSCEVVVVNLGDVPAAADVEITFDDGSRALEHWDGRRRWHRFEIEGPSRVASVTIDPQDRVLLNDGKLRSSWRTRRSVSASARVGARAQFWTQTLMQLTGL
jgi:hypothetical protein